MQNTYRIPIYKLLIFFFAVVALLYVFHIRVVDAEAEKITCDFLGVDAQRMYSLYPDKYSRLDRDKDGKACE